MAGRVTTRIDCIVGHSWSAQVNPVMPPPSDSGTFLPASKRHPGTSGQPTKQKDPIAHAPGMRDVKRTAGGVGGGAARRNVADRSSSKTPSHETGIIPDFFISFFPPFCRTETEQPNRSISIIRSRPAKRINRGGKLTPRCRTHRDFKLLMKKLTALDCLP